MTELDEITAKLKVLAARLDMSGLEEFRKLWDRREALLLESGQMRILEDGTKQYDVEFK